MTPGEAALREAARMETARVYGATCRESRAPRKRKARPASAFPERPLESYYGPAPAHLIAELVAVTTTPGLTRIETDLIEQALARGWAGTRINAELGFGPADVKTVRDAMNRAAS